MAPGSDWREVLGPVDAELLAFHRRLVDVQLRMAALQLGQLRRRRGIGQAAVAKALAVSQPNVSRIEQEDDLRLSTLARYVAALGGDLELRAVFPDESVELLPPAGQAGAK
jgi:transcriptional regulator with XRE-family HTH domain